MSDSHFHTPEALRLLDDDALAALWSDVPTERQKAYRQAYDRAVRDAGASGADALELQVARELLRRYADDALVPVGSRWARTPSRVRQAAMDNTRLGAPDELNAGQNVPLWAVFGGGLAVLLLVGVLVMRLVGGNSAETPDAVGMVITPTVTASPTPAASRTPTPLALEAQDAVIRGGDDARQPVYPVSLQVSTGDNPPRVWVVQRRDVRASEWRYDPNPDTASLVGGLSVRPVIGVPWSAGNAALFEHMNADTRFTLTLNTGAVQHFVFAERRVVRRSQTDTFRQVSPGMVLVLMGETGADGLPTGSRTLVTADYPPEQELSRSGVLADAPLAVMSDDRPTVTPLPFDGLDVQLVSVTTQPGRLTTVLRLFNDGYRLHLVTPDDITLALGYAPNPSGPQVPALEVTSFTLRPGQAADVTLVWRWDGEPFAALTVAATRYSAALP